MIKSINMKEPDHAAQVLDIQIPSYKVEAKLLGFDAIPQLSDTMETIMNCSEKFYGYYMDDNLTGAIAVEEGKNEVFISRLIVHPFYFRRGIGKALVQYVLENYDNIDTIKVSTGSGNMPALGLYRKLGFVKAEEREVAPEFSLVYLEKDMRVPAHEKNS